MARGEQDPGPVSEVAPRVASALVTGLATVPPRSAPRDYPQLRDIAPDHHLLGDVIAEGGMGRIRRARDRRLGRDVAVKEVRDPSPPLPARLEREAGKLSQEAIEGIELREDELASKRKP